MKRFTRDGRNISFDGKTLVYISREGDTRPVIADDLAKLIVKFLNSSRKAKSVAEGHMLHADEE
jgi:hypothetical protein